MVFRCDVSLDTTFLLFPELTFASMVGTIKVGSISRNGAAVWAIEEIELRSLWLLVPLGSGSVTGALFVSSMTEVIVPFVLLVGLFK